jgi:hypothetical protein
LAAAEEHLAQPLRAQIGVDAARQQQAAPPALAQQFERAFEEELIEVEVGRRFPAADCGALVFVLLRRPKVGAQVGETAQVVEVLFAEFRPPEQACQLPLEVSCVGSAPLYARIEVAAKLFRDRFENLPRRVGDDRVEAAPVL